MRYHLREFLYHLLELAVILFGCLVLGGIIWLMLFTIRATGH